MSRELEWALSGITMVGLIAFFVINSDKVVALTGGLLQEAVKYAGGIASLKAG